MEFNYLYNEEFEGYLIQFNYDEQMKYAFEDDLIDNLSPINLGTNKMFFVDVEDIHGYWEIHLDYEESINVVLEKFILSCSGFIFNLNTNIEVKLPEKVEVFYEVNDSLVKFDVCDSLITNYLLQFGLYTTEYDNIFKAFKTADIEEFKLGANNNSVYVFTEK